MHLPCHAVIADRYSPEPAWTISCEAFEVGDHERVREVRGGFSDDIGGRREPLLYANSRRRTSKDPRC